MTEFEFPNAEGGTDVRIPAPTAGATATAGVPRLVMRNYFSTYLLAAAGQMTMAAAEIEQAHDVTGPSRFDLAQRGHLLGAVLCAVGFLESMVNELFQDAFDKRPPPDGQNTSPTGSTQTMMAEYWRTTHGRGRALDKYQALLRFSGKPELNEGARPYQDANLVVQLRNAIAHYRPEDLSSDQPAQLEKRLKGRFPDNRLLAGSGNPWWPDVCLGAGCAQWAMTSVVALADHVVGAIGVKPNYVVHRASGWFGPLPESPAG